MPVSAGQAKDLQEFDDLCGLDDRLIVRGFQRIGWNDLVYAYIGASEQTRRKLKRGMTGAGAKYLENITAHWQPVDSSAWKIAQARILEQYRALLRTMAATQVGPVEKGTPGAR